MVFKIVEYVIVVSYEVCDLIFKQGEKVDYFYMVLIGFVCVFWLSKDGCEVDIGIYGLGEIFVEGVMFNGGMYCFCVQIVEFVMMVCYEVDKFKQFVFQDFVIGIVLMVLLLCNFDQVLECVVDDWLYIVL